MIPILNISQQYVCSDTRYKQCYPENESAYELQQLLLNTLWACWVIYDFTYFVVLQMTGISKQCVMTMSEKRWLITINSQNRNTNKASFNNKFCHKYVTVVSAFIQCGTGMIWIIFVHFKKGSPNLAGHSQ